MSDTIAAIATPPGRGGVGIVRVSGPLSAAVCREIVGCVPRVRFAHYAPFLAENGSTLDEGLSIFFKGPDSFTGEDVLELHGHGGPVILDMLLRRVLSLGVRMARAGEFSERAFLNNKLDLVQAEAVAQLINAGSEQAAIAAMRSLQGDFSQAIHELVDSLIKLRLYVEAAIDFPEEEINFLADGHVLENINLIESGINAIYERAKHGALLCEGVNVVIVGLPNAGKSTLLNKLTGEETSIVTHVAGTTRDIVKAQISLDGILLNVLDTAGLRDTADVVEREGVARAWRAIEKADLILLVLDSVDAQDPSELSWYHDLKCKMPKSAQVLVIYNKIDKLSQTSKLEKHGEYGRVYLSAHTGDGLDVLRQEIKGMLGINTDSVDAGLFVARRRHLTELERAQLHLVAGKQQLIQHGAGELLAEDLQQAQRCLSEITGAFSSDDLLGKIFSEFCIGK